MVKMTKTIGIGFRWPSNHKNTLLGGVLMSDVIPTKKCSKCQEIKSVSEFYKNKVYKDGLVSHCKQCAIEYVHRYRKNNPDKIKELSKKYTENKYSKGEKLTQNKLKEELDYNPKTGIFTLKKDSGSKLKKGDIAGSINKVDGYIRIQIDHKKYLASRLAWFYMEGYWPENEIDHHNRIKTDNSFDNLRHVTRTCNARNSGKGKRNSSGVVGVDWHLSLNNWRATITINNKQIHLLSSKNFDDVVMARWLGEKKYNFPNCNTLSSAYQYLKNQGLI